MTPSSFNVVVNALLSLYRALFLVGIAADFFEFLKHIHVARSTTSDDNDNST